MAAEGTTWTWFISLIAIGLFAWGMAELLGLGPTEPATTTTAPIAAELATGAGGEPAVELHRLLPDATDDVGRLVTTDGTVVGDASPSGFWVRDLRDNIVFVHGESARVRTGDAVRVLGRVALLSPEEQADRLEAAGLVVPTGAVVIRDVKIQPTANGVEVLQE